MVQQAFDHTGVHAMGFVEVGDADDGLPAPQATRLLEVIRAQMPDTQLVAHAEATGHPYMLLSKASSNARFTDVRVVSRFVSQTYRKALRATLAGAGRLVDLWLVHLASSGKRPLSDGVHRQMLSKLVTGRPTVIAGDINTF